MSVQIQEAVEMPTEDEQTAPPAAPEDAPPAALQNGEVSEQTAVSAEQTEEAASELTVPGWSIVSFEGVAMSGLSYEEARRWVEKLSEQKISGLCIVTDEAAARTN
jgi:hypothetical protein